MSIVTVEPQDLDFETARRAHMWTSYDADKRAVAEQLAYAHHVQSFIDEIAQWCQTPEQRALAQELLAAYRVGYLARYAAYLHAMSNQANPLIVGPAGYDPVRQHKATQHVNRLASDMQAWSAHEQGRILDAIVPAAGRRAAGKAQRDQAAETYKAYILAHVKPGDMVEFRVGGGAKRQCVRKFLGKAVVLDHGLKFGYTAIRPLQANGDAMTEAEAQAHFAAWRDLTVASEANANFQHNRVVDDMLATGSGEPD